MKNFYRIIFLILLLATVSGEALAKTFTIDNIIYMTYTEDPATVIVMGYKKTPVDVVIPSTVTYSDKEYTVTEIADVAFKGCESLKSVVLPPTLQVLGFGAFRLCTSLESINIPDGVVEISNSCFENCESLQSIVIPESVIEIAGTAFARCNSLTSVEIPAGVTILGQFAFNMCENLQHVKIGAGVTGVADYTFGYCDSLIDFEVSGENENLESPDGVLIDKVNGSLVQYPLANPRESYTVPDNVTTIKSGAFLGGKYIKHIVCSNNLKRIDDASFNSCKSLESISVGNSLQRIGGGAFAYCTALERLELPATVTDIAKQAFFLNTSLKEYVVAPENKVYSSTEGVLFNKSQTTLLFYPIGSDKKEYIFPETVKEIEGHAFRGNKELESVVINEGVETLPDAVFYECVGLQTASIPKSVSLINHWAFFGCSSLEEIVIPENVESMGSQPFYGCTSLMKVTSERETPPYIGDETFIGVPKAAILYVPNDCVEVYSAALGWDYFDNIMVIGSGVNETSIERPALFTIYTLDGVCVGRNVDASYISTVPAGIYVVNGRKMIVR